VQTTYVEIEEGAPYPHDLANRVMAGEVFVVRRCLNTLGIFGEIAETSLDAIRSVSGLDAAATVKRGRI
jgi:hypothetical protein